MRLSDIFPRDVLVKRNGDVMSLDEIEATSPRALVYAENLIAVRLANANPNVGAILTKPSLERFVAAEKGCALTDDPRLAFFSLYLALPTVWGDAEPSGDIAASAVVHPTAQIGEGVRIGEQVRIGPLALIEPGTSIGDGCIIGPGARIGVDGLFVLRKHGALVHVRHRGGVAVGRNTQILANAVVARALFRTPTSIGDDCLIGIAASIGHGAWIGDGSVVTGGCIVGGRCKIGRGVHIGIHSAIAPGLVVGDDAQIKMGSIVIDDVAAGQVVSGNFARPHLANLQSGHLRQRRPEATE
ncbi:MAG TPA: DapH/DapD/GlmU-related protein [Vicinamibacterales bacterium]|nr:DapH/DapD/GlmU-related protein [Vicinamibacterales bacterium]